MTENIGWLPKQLEVQARDVKEEDRNIIASTAVLCQEAATKLGNHGSFRLRVLLQMILIELTKELEVQVSDPLASMPEADPDPART